MLYLTISLAEFDSVALRFAAPTGPASNNTAVDCSQRRSSSSIRTQLGRVYTDACSLYANIATATGWRRTSSTRSSRANPSGTRPHRAACRSSIHEAFNLVSPNLDCVYPGCSKTGIIDLETSSALVARNLGASKLLGRLGNLSGRERIKETRFLEFFERRKQHDQLCRVSESHLI